MPASPDVGDVLQETNLVLWTKREKFEIGTNYLAWAFTIARYEVKKYRSYRKRAADLRFSEKFIEAFSCLEPPAGLHEDYLRSLEGCLSKLSDKERELVNYRYTPGYSLRKLATDHEISPGTLRSSLFRIRQTLRTCIENQRIELKA